MKNINKLFYFQYSHGGFRLVRGRLRRLSTNHTGLSRESVEYHSFSRCRLTFYGGIRREIPSNHSDFGSLGQGNLHREFYVQCVAARSILIHGRTP